MAKNVPDNSGNDIWWRPALLVFAQMSGWIGIPVIIGLFVGRWLDERYQTEPWLFIASTGIAFIISIIGMVREATRAMKQLDESSSEDQKKDGTNK